MHYEDILNVINGINEDPWMTKGLECFKIKITWPYIGKFEEIQIDCRQFIAWKVREDPDIFRFPPESIEGMIEERRKNLIKFLVHSGIVGGSGQANELIDNFVRGDYEVPEDMKALRKLANVPMIKRLGSEFNPRMIVNSYWFTPAYYISKLINGKDDEKTIDIVRAFDEMSYSGTFYMKVRYFEGFIRQWMIEYKKLVMVAREKKACDIKITWIYPIILSDFHPLKSNSSIVRIKDDLIVMLDAVRQGKDNSVDVFKTCYDLCRGISTELRAWDISESYVNFVREFFPGLSIGDALSKILGYVNKTGENKKLLLAVVTAHYLLHLSINGIGYDANSQVDVSSVKITPNCRCGSGDTRIMIFDKVRFNETQKLIQNRLLEFTQRGNGDIACKLEERVKEIRREYDAMDKELTSIVRELSIGLGKSITIDCIKNASTFENLVSKAGIVADAFITGDQFMRKKKDLYKLREKFDEASSLSSLSAWLGNKNHLYNENEYLGFSVTFNGYSPSFNVIVNPFMVKDACPSSSLIFR